MTKNHSLGKWKVYLEAGMETGLAGEEGSFI